MGNNKLIMFAAAPFAYGAGYGYGAPYGAYGGFGGYGLGFWNQKGGNHGPQQHQLQELHGGMPGANGLANQNTYLHQNVFGGMSGFSDGLPPHNTYTHSDVTGVSTASNPFFGTAGAARTTFPGVPTAGAGFGAAPFFQQQQ